MTYMFSSSFITLLSVNLVTKIFIGSLTPYTGALSLFNSLLKMFYTNLKGPIPL